MRLYRDDDWAELTTPDPNALHIRGFAIPYVVFENEDDGTTNKPELLGMRLEETFGKLV